MSTPSGTNTGNVAEARPSFKKGLELRLRDLQDWLTAEHERELLSLREQNKQLQTELQHKGEAEIASHMVYTPVDGRKSRRTHTVAAHAAFDIRVAPEHEPNHSHGNHGNHSNFGKHLGLPGTSGSKNEARDHLQQDLENVQRMKRRTKTVSATHSLGHDLDVPPRRDDGSASLPLQHLTDKVIHVASDGFDKLKGESQLGAKLAGGKAKRSLDKSEVASPSRPSSAKPSRPSSARPSSASGKNQPAFRSEAEQDVLSESEGEGSKEANRIVTRSCQFLPVTQREDEAYQKLLLRRSSSDGLDRAAMKASKQMNKAALAKVSRNKVVPIDAAPESTTTERNNKVVAKSSSVDSLPHFGVVDDAAKRAVSPDGSGPPFVDAMGTDRAALPGSVFRPSSGVATSNDELRDAETTGWRRQEAAARTKKPTRQRRMSAPSTLTEFTMKRMSGGETSARQRAKSVTDAVGACVRLPSATQSSATGSGISTATTRTSSPNLRMLRPVACWEMNAPQRDDVPLARRASRASAQSEMKSKSEPLVRPVRSEPAESESFFALREGWKGFSGSAPGPAWEIIHGRTRQDSLWRSMSDSSDWGSDGLMMRPASRKRTVWDVAIFSVIAHDVIMVPLRVFDFPGEMATLIADWVGNIFWMFDIAASFTTGIYIHGELEMRPRPVAIHYLQTWFLFDVLLLMIQWFLLADSGEMNSRTLVSLARMLRFLRMLRVLRLDPVFHDILCRFHFSERSTIVVGISRQATYLAVAIHLIACAWYGIGYEGWVQEEFHKDTSTGYRYLASLRWALSQLLGSTDINPSNTGEAAFAVLVQILGYIFFCVIMSCALRSLAALEDLRSETRKKQRALARYLKKHRISPSLSIRVNKFIAQHEDKNHEDEFGSAPADVLFGLSQKLQDDISEEIRRPVVMGYQFLIDIDDENTRMIVQLCHEAIFEEGFRSSDIVFSCGDACRRMLFVASGTFDYVLLRRPNPGQRNTKPDRERSAASVPVAGRSDCLDGFATLSTDWGTGTCSLDVAAEGVEDLQDSLERGRYLCEAILWTRWEYCGELSADMAGTIFALDAQQFAEVVSQHASASYYAVRYATKFVRCLNRTDKCSDLVRFRIDKVTLEEEAQYEEKQRLARNVSMSSLKVAGYLGKYRRPRGTARHHYIFISHHKAGAGTEAALMQEALARLISEDPDHVGCFMDAPVFLDSEDLVDLTDLKVHVKNSINLVLLLTTEVLERPWVLVEIVTAKQSGINIIPVEVQKREANFDYPDEAYFKKIREGSLDGAASALLQSEGISMAELETALRHLFKKIALPFSPHKSANVREAELIDILRRCQDGDAPTPAGPCLTPPGMM